VLAKLASPKRLLALALAAVLAAALLGAGLAVAEKPTVVRAGNLVLALNGGVSPRALPKHRMAPIALRISGRIGSADGSQPPAAKFVVADFDRNGRVNARGLPVCRPGLLQARSTADVKAACPKAIVGSGRTTVRVAFPEQQPFYASGPLVLFNGGVRGRVTTMYIHAYVNVPAPTAIVTPVTIKRVRKGRFGTRAVARIPKIAGGSGSLTRFEMKIQRRFRFHGKRQSYLLARCADGRFLAHGDVAFVDGSGLGGTVVRSCRSRG
jgi:hypothetical protein